MATTTFSASTLVTAYYAHQSRYSTDGAVQGARWRNTYSAELVGILGIPSLANVAWTGKIITAASLTVTTRSLTKYDTIRLYGSNYNKYYSDNSKYGYEYIDTDGGYTDISIGTSDTGDHTVTLTASNIAWLQSTLRDGKTYFCMYYAGDTATSSVPQSTHYYGCNAFSLSITYADAKSEIDSVTNAEIGSATTLTWTNYATTGRTCKVRFTLGNADSGEITANGSSYSYTLPSSWYNELPTSTSGTATAYLYTYINGTLIGTETATFTASVSSAIVPSIGSISATKQNSNATVAGWDIWLQSYTQAVIAVSGCAAGTGATIASYTFSGQDMSSTVSTTEASASATSSSIQVSGDLTYTVKITDSRGRTATSTVSITVLAYAAPNISAAVATRCDSDGTVNEITGEYGKAYITFSYSSVGSNAVTNSISYKLHTYSTYTTVQENIASTTWSNVFGTLDVASSYDVQGYVVDSLGNSSTYVTKISSISGIAFGLKNDRARFGGVTEKAGLQVDWDSYFEKTVSIKKRVLEELGHTVQTISTSGTGYVKVFDFEVYSGAVVGTAVVGTTYVGMSGYVGSPITLEFIRTSDTRPTTITINIANGTIVTDNSTDVYLAEDALYIGKSESDDIIEILDMHNPWTNEALVITWDGNVSSLPVTYTQASHARGSIAYDTRTVTTNANGYYTYSDFSRSSYLLIQANTTTANAYVLSVGASNGTDQIIRVVASDGTAIASTSVTIAATFIAL